jgi:Fur family peroxide stress response transcriptional regulator
MANIKYSRQREAIKEYLSNTKEHPTADTIYMDIREIYPHISLGTIYRNLNLLVERGEVIRIKSMDESDRYDGNTHDHYHFLCNKCKRVLDIEMESISQIKTIANKDFPGKIEGHVTYFYGTCDKCK